MRKKFKSRSSASAKWAKYSSDADGAPTPGPKSNLQPDERIRQFCARELDESSRFVQKSAESKFGWNNPKQWLISAQTSTVGRGENEDRRARQAVDHVREARAVGADDEGRAAPVAGGALDVGRRAPLPGKDIDAAGEARRQCRDERLLGADVALVAVRAAVVDDLRRRRGYSPRVFQKVRNAGSARAAASPGPAGTRPEGARPGAGARTWARSGGGTANRRSGASPTRRCDPRARGATGARRRPPRRRPRRRRP